MDNRIVNRICAKMKAHGFMMYREHFHWGHTPAFRNEEGTQFYFVDTHVVDDKLVYMVCTPLSLLRHLQDTWRPASRKDSDYYLLEMEPELRGLPKTPDWPHGDILGEPGPVKQKPRFTAAQIQAHDDGICTACGEVQSGGCEPDLRKGKCEVCGERAVYGLEEAMLHGFIELDL